MTRLHFIPRRSLNCKRQNLLTVIILGGVFSILYVGYSSSPAGADSSGMDSELLRIASQTPVAPVPPLPTSGTKADGKSANSAPGMTRHLTLLSMLLLEKGRDRLEKIPGYSTTFFKRERINGKLGDGQTTQMKMRHKPYSVYMKWLDGDKGRELLYVDGKNKNKLIVHAGGWKARLLPALKLDPKGSLAMSESRYPITDAGVLQMANIIIGNRKNDLDSQAQVRVSLIENHKFAKRDCYCFTFEYEDPKFSEVYRKSTFMIDKEYSLPVCAINYAWPESDEKLSPQELDEQTLIEQYSYLNLNMTQQLADADFDSKNKSYKFKR